MLKAALLRLLGNLAEYRETASLVTAHSSLLDKIALLIMNETKVISEAAIRTIRQVSRHKVHVRVGCSASNCVGFNAIINNYIFST